MNNQGGNQGYPYGQPSNFNGNQGYPYGQGINQNGTNINLGVQPNVEYQQHMNYQKYQQVPNGTVPGNENNTNKKKSKKIFAFVAIAIIVIAAILVFIFLSGDKDGINGQKKKRKEPTMNRTIMIYMVGSDLETNGNASAELNHIRPNNIDLENNNIIMIAGGSKVWGNNYIDPNETSTYQLKENGFEKVKQDGVKNMGDANTLLDFLNYAYEFYPAKKYELIFWNHGSGIVGLESDDIYGDMLNFSELQMAFSKSPFKEEKLDSILFINCLLGNIELAGVIDDYADYMIASEEISYTHPFVDKFKFFEEITVEDNGFEFGKKFVDNLTSNNFLNANAKSYNTPTTYSIIDLSKISQVERDLNNFVKAINLNQDYEQIALSRSSMFQYGGEYLEFDMIDLSSFVSKLQALAPTEASKLISSLSEAIVYNYSLDSTSKGLSVYFPYNAEKKNVDFQIKLLEELENSSANDYLAFIKNFDLYRRTKTSYSMDLTNNKVNTLSGDFSMQLSEGQQKDFASASYIIVKESTKGNFTPIYFSDNTTLDSNGKLKANFDGKIVMALDTMSNQMLPIVAYEKQNGTYMTTIQLENTDKGISSNANAYISFQGGDGKIHLAVEKVDNEKLEMQLPDMSILTLENYQKLVFTNHDYAISNGNGGVSNKWTSSGEEHKVNALVNHYKIQKVDIDRTAKYYFAFKVRDLSNEITYSKLVEIK